MQTAEFKKIWIFLGQHYPTSKRYRSEASFKSYDIVLRPFAVKDVERAALEYVRSGKAYFPDVSELLEYIPQKSKAPVKVDAAGVLGNVRAWAAITGTIMPGGMTAAEAVAWYKKVKADRMALPGGRT